MPILNFGSPASRDKKYTGIHTNTRFRVTPSQLDAISHNVNTTQHGVRRSPNRSGDSIVSAMQRLESKLARAGRTDVRSAEAHTTKLFGDALGGEVHKDLGLAYTTAAASDREGDAAVKAGKMIQKGGEQAKAATAAGSAQAQAGAKYELQQALKELAASGGSDAAQAKVDFYSMMLQHQWDVQAKKQDDASNMAYLRAQARMSGSGSSGATGGYTSAASDLQEFLGETVSVKQPDGTETEVPAHDAQAQANYVQSLVGQYNLGPDAASQLRGVALTRVGAATDPNPAQQQAIASAAAFVSNQAATGQVGALTDQNILDALHIVPQSNGTVLADGTTFPIEWAVQALAMFKQAYTGPLAAASSTT